MNTNNPFNTDITETQTDVPGYPNHGRVFNNRYRLIDTIDTGGMGRVYKALDEAASEIEGKEKYVAIKVLLPQLSHNRRAVKRLQREALRAQELRHEHIVGVYNFDSEGDWTYLLMEWLDGESLEDALEDELDGFALDSVKTHLKTIGAALSYAHNKGVIHRDIKPNNIILTKEQRLVLIDFGLSQEAKQSLSRLSTNAQQSSGTVVYMPPEALVAGHPANIKDDIYGLAATVYELLTGYPPFIEAACWNRTVDTPLPHKPPQLDETQWQVLSSALAFTPDDRPDSVASFVNDFCSSGNARNEEKETRQVTKHQVKTQPKQQQAKPQTTEQKIDHYLIHNNGTVTDTRNGLMWQRIIVGETWKNEEISGKPKEFTWNEAMEVRDNFAGYSDWRLPTIDELTSLIYCSSGEPDFYPGREGCTGDFQEPTINTKVFFMQRRTGWFRFLKDYDYFWSSSQYKPDDDKAWAVFFHSGYDQNYSKGHKQCVRLVRSTSHH